MTFPTDLTDDADPVSGAWANGRLADLLNRIGAALNSGGGGSVQTVELTLSMTTTPIGVAGGLVLGEVITFIVDPVALTGTEDRVVSTPTLDYAAGAMLTWDTGLQASKIPEGADPFDIGVTITIVNDVGTQVATLTATKSIPAHTPTGTIADTDLVFASVTGADLTWATAGATGTLSTSAGGKFGIVVAYAGGWD